MSTMFYLKSGDKVSVSPANGTRDGIIHRVTRLAVQSSLEGYYFFSHDDPYTNPLMDPRTDLLADVNKISCQFVVDALATLDDSAMGMYWCGNPKTKIQVGKKSRRGGEKKDDPAIYHRAVEVVAEDWPNMLEAIKKIRNGKIKKNYEEKTVLETIGEESASCQAKLEFTRRELVRACDILGQEISVLREFVRRAALWVGFKGDLSDLPLSAANFHHAILDEMEMMYVRDRDLKALMATRPYRVAKFFSNLGKRLSAQQRA